MRILLLGAGGREHAIAWKLKQSPRCEKLFIAPGNAGTAHCGTNLPFGVTDFQDIIQVCKTEKINLVIVGPEEPLVKGIVDLLAAEVELKGMLIIGPDKKAAQLEGSKAFAKAFMQRNKIPTASYKEFTLDNYEAGVTFLQDHPLPIVLKADGLAAGKGVVICQHHLEAVAEFELMIQRAKFGEASKKVVVEQFLDGMELSVFVLTDGEHYVILPEAKDYKRVGEGDAGPNTGGMGAVSPVSFANDKFMKKVEEKIIRPTIKGLQKEGINYKGFIFFGIMKVGNEPFMIEYNCRLGDPETEVILPRLKNDLIDLFENTATGKLDKTTIKTDDRFAATVMAVSGGYPNEHQKGYEITGLDKIKNKNTIIFHSGTREENGQVLTNGGRVFCITSLSDSISEAIGQSLDMMNEIYFPEIYYRRDIGWEFMEEK